MKTNLVQKGGKIRMIRSMTGFGRCRASVGGRDILVEIKSVNSRFFDCNVKISRAFGYLEERIKPYLQERGVTRGKVDVSVSVERTDGSGGSVALDEVYLKDYLAALHRMRDTYDLRDDISVMEVAHNPAVFTAATPEEDPATEWENLRTVLAGATDAFLLAREKEGAALVRDLSAKLAAVRELADAIEAKTKTSVGEYRERLAEKIREALADNRITPDETRLLTECAVYADKIAVDEELVRLRTHFQAMEGILSGDGAIGRRLDFLLQEMNREINTIGSKCNDAVVAHLVVDVKCELEKMREQVQNLE